MKTSILLALALMLAFVWAAPVLSQPPAAPAPRRDSGPISWVMEDLPNYVIALKKTAPPPPTETYFEITVDKDTVIEVLKPTKGSFRDLQPGARTTEILYVQKAGKPVATKVTIIGGAGGD